MLLCRSVYRVIRGIIELLDILYEEHQYSHHKKGRVVLMKNYPVSTKKAPSPGGAYVQASVWGECVYVSGQVGKNPHDGLLAANFHDQVTQAISNLRDVLHAAGARLDTVLKTTCFLSNMEHFAEFDSVYRSFFTEPYPARSTVGVTLAPGLLFEIDAVAFRADGDAAS